MDKKYILGIDCGTSRIKVMIVDRYANQIGFESAELIILKPREGYVEQNPLVIWDSVYELIVKVFSNNGIVPKQIAAIGITNQRETTVVWNKKTGMPYSNAVVWLDKRAVPLCEQVSKKMDSFVVERVGMYTIPNTSAMILTWLLQNDPLIMEGVKKKEACFGTINSWLLWKLTGEEVHCTDISNMSVTQLQDARKLIYDEEVLNSLQIPREILPELKGTGEIYGRTTEKLFSGEKIPVAGMLGDQMAATLGQGCVKKDMLTSTYGTGCFIVMNTGEQYIPPASGLFSPLLWGDKKNPTYGLEGFFEIHGERRDKAVLEDVVYQTTDVIKTMERVTDQSISILRIDGGMSKNDYLCQFQADLLG
ncbi:MAG: hypothetical protein GQ534_05390, partial [Candidatus Delongbacteria bacterium]|nr:hypothetical protein [Candidatus Delongbacteria bacterium]